MKLKDLPVDPNLVSKYDLQGRYENKCSDCGTAHVVFTQLDDTPEYYTGVFVVCHVCEELVEFCLPVN